MCHCPPPVVDGLGLRDFYRLIRGIDHAAQQAQAAANGQEGVRVLA